MPAPRAVPHGRLTTVGGGALETRRVNQSELAAFMRCPRKWRWGYVDGWQSTATSPALSLGTAVHRVLQAHYSGGSWVEEYNDLTCHQLDLEIPNFDLRLFEAMCEGYFEWLEDTGVDAHLTPVLVEEKLEMSLGPFWGQEVVLHGTVDLVQQDPDGGLWLIDHKTTAAFEALDNRTMQSSFQLQTYSLLAEHHLGRPVSGAVYNMLRKVKRTGSAKPPFFQRAEVLFNPHQKKAFLNQIRMVVSRMLDAEDFHLNYPVVDQDCQWKCSFVQVCGMADDGSDINGALSDLYVKKEVV